MLPPSFTPALLAQLELLKIRTRRAFLGNRAGGHLSLKRGHGIEFSDYRHYELGDNPRHIDWGVYARSDRLYVKRFQEEQNLSVLIVLDTSASMGVPEHEGKWTTARDIALMLSYVALMEQDSVSVAALGAFQTPGLSGGRAVHQLAGQLMKLEPGRAFDPPLEFHRAAARIRFPGAAVIISDFLWPFEQIEQSILALRARNLDITAIQVLSPSDVSPGAGEDNLIAVDSETGEEISLHLNDTQRERYGTLLIEHNQKLKNFLADCRIPYALAGSAQPLGSFLNEKLLETGLLV